jgi:hypothetical protein
MIGPPILSISRNKHGRRKPHRAKGKRVVAERPES